MLLQLLSGLTGAVTTTEPDKKENLRALAAGVREEMARTEELFNLTEDDALMDTAIYKLKSLTAYQEYLLKAIREDELGDTEGFIVEAAQPHNTREEGLAMG
ncbi:MAG: hypothetical protein RR461_10645 [Angelakisella sp.]